MTFLDKFNQEHPGVINNKQCIGFGCPFEYNYEENKACSKNSIIPLSCYACWNREIPEEKETYSLEEVKEMCEIDEVIQRLEAKELKKGLVKGLASPNKEIVNAAAEIASKIDPDIVEKFNAIPNVNPISPKDLRKVLERSDNSIKDSGDRTQFATGAVRDMHEGKGRCDLLPLDVIAMVYNYIEEDIMPNWLFIHFYNFQQDGDINHLLKALECFNGFDGSIDTMFLEVAKHFEDGAKKYGEYNWQKGIPVNCYIDSAVRHYLKYLRGDEDERHDRAFVWNILCCIWTCKHKPELNCYRKVEEDENRSDC